MIIKYYKWMSECWCYSLRHYTRFFFCFYFFFSHNSPSTLEQKPSLFCIYKSNLVPYNIGWCEWYVSVLHLFTTEMMLCRLLAITTTLCRLTVSHKHIVRDNYAYARLQHWNPGALFLLQVLASMNMDAAVLKVASILFCKFVSANKILKIKYITDIEN